MQAVESAKSQSTADPHVVLDKITKTYELKGDAIESIRSVSFQVERGGLKVQFAGIQAAENKNLFHHAGHAPRVAGDGLQLFLPLARLHSAVEIPEQFAGGLDDAQRRAKLV